MGKYQNVTFVYDCHKFYKMAIGLSWFNSNSNSFWSNWIIHRLEIAKLDLLTLNIYLLHANLPQNGNLFVKNYWLNLLLLWVIAIIMAFWIGFLITHVLWYSTTKGLCRIVLSVSWMDFLHIFRSVDSLDASICAEIRTRIPDTIAWDYNFEPAGTHPLTFTVKVCHEFLILLANRAWMTYYPSVVVVLFLMCLVIRHRGGPFSKFWGSSNSSMIETWSKYRRKWSYWWKTDQLSFNN